MLKGRSTALGSVVVLVVLSSAAAGLSLASSTSVPSHKPVRVNQTTGVIGLLGFPSRPAIPASWRTVTFGGLTMKVPRDWPTVRARAWGDCGYVSQPLFRPSTVLLDTGTQDIPYSCPAERIGAPSTIPPVYGLVIDPGPYSPLQSGLGDCVQINDYLELPACETDYGGILVVAVQVPGAARPVVLEVGLAGHGEIARTILYSIRPSSPIPPPATTSTTTPAASSSLSVSPLFLGPRFGVVVENSETTGCSTVYITVDFVHWKNITPPKVAPPGAVPGQCFYIWQSASFISADDGWILGRDGGSTDTILFHTLNGGETWTRQPGDGTGSNFGSEVIGFTSAEVGWRQQFATGSNGPYSLELTKDAGSTWSLLPSIESHGGCQDEPVVFSDPSIAFAAQPLSYAYSPASWMWRTTNGGASWTQVSVTTPPRLAGATAYYGAPQFFGDVGILSVAFTKGRSTLVAFYRSTDEGIHWELMAILPTQSALQTGLDYTPGDGEDSCGASNGSGAFPVVGVASPKIWWVVGTSANGSRVIAVTANGGETWSSASPIGIPPYVVSTQDQEYASQEGFVYSLQASSPRRAWMSVIEGANVESQTAVLIQTTDGGRTWSAVQP